MPMSWTPENDRLLLLKLIETHGISVDSNKIVAAWPKDGVQPSARAITERFVKLRQLAGIKVSITPGGTPGRGRARTSKYSTPRKRKNKTDSSDESDGDEHLTENESPTKKQSVQRASGIRGRGNVRGGRGRGGRGATMNVSSPSIRIKSEYPLSELPVDPMDANAAFERDAADAAFERNRAEAAAIHRSAQENPFNCFKSSGFNGGMNGGIANGFQGFSPSSGHGGLNGFGMSDGNNLNGGFPTPDMTLGDPFAASSHPGHGFVNGMQTFNNGLNVASAGDAHAPKRMNAARNKSARAASAHASEGVAEFLRRQKDADKEDGEQSSAEDSQASEYHELEADYI